MAKLEVFMPILKKTLSNGVRVLVEPIDVVQSASLGIWCHTGSKNELANEAGITHLIEHMLFKGTEKRTAKDIAEAIEGRGGILNAFTDKEVTCYYARILSDDVENAFDVLSDMMRNSLIDPDELNREKKVVLEEIKRGEDEPSDQVHELQMGNRWGDHALGKPIIGTKESVSSFDRPSLATYMDRRYLGENVIASIAGNVNPESFFELAERFLGSLPAGGEQPALTAPEGKPGRHELHRNVEQVHFCIGADSCSLYAPELYTAALLDAAMGGGMSSRLFQEVREKRGLVYSIGTYNVSYSLGGLFNVYGGTGLETWDEVQEVVLAEFAKVREKGLAEAEMTRLKRNIRGNMVLALESMSSRMRRMTQNELFHRREIPVEETLARIDAVTNEQIIELAQRVLDPDQLTLTAIRPK